MQLKVTIWRATERGQANCHGPNGCDAGYVAQVGSNLQCGGLQAFLTYADSNNPKRRQAGALQTVTARLTLPLRLRHRNCLSYR